MRLILLFLITIASGKTFQSFLNLGAYTPNLHEKKRKILRVIVDMLILSSLISISVNVIR